MRMTSIWSAVLLLLSPFPAAAGLIANGDFETGDFTGWTVSGAAFNCGNTIPGISTIGPYSGTYSACFGSPDGLTFISQVLTTAPGQEYEVSFWYAQQPPDYVPSNEVEIIWGGTTVVNAFNIPVTPWKPAAFEVTASGTSTQIEFGFDNVPGWFALDDVSVDAVPEPRTGILCGIGLALLAASSARVKVTHRR
jgi:hypothetical protein